METALLQHISACLALLNSVRPGYTLDADNSIRKGKRVVQFESILDDEGNQNWLIADRRLTHCVELDANNIFLAVRYSSR